MLDAYPRTFDLVHVSGFFSAKHRLVPETTVKKQRGKDHNIIKQCACIHVGPENITMDAPT